MSTVLVLALLPPSVLLPSATPALAAILSVTSTNDSGAGSLRAQIAAAGSGGTIDFAPSVAGQTITLSSELVISKDLTIQNNSGGTIAVDGNNASRVFHITAGTVTLQGLTIQHGRAPQDPVTNRANGGGVSIEAGARVTLDRDVLQANEARGPDGTSGTTSIGGGPGTGGAIANAGSLIVTNSTVTENRAQGGNGSSGSGGGGGIGAGLFNEGQATILASTFANNQAEGGNGGSGLSGAGGGGGLGGAIFQRSGVLLLTDVTLVQNGSTGGAGGAGISGGSIPDGSGVGGGFGQGGGGGGGSLGAGIAGGSGGTGGGGGAGSFGGGGSGGTGGGGGGTGFGAGGSGGTGGGGGAASPIPPPLPGGGGGGGLGAGLFVDGGTASIRSATITGNTTAGGSGGTSGGGGGQGIGAGLFVNAGSVTLGATIVANNTANSDPDVHGTLSSQGYNLVKNAAGASGLTGPGEQLGADPLLDTLQVNPPGLAATMALLSGSPAIDNGPPGGCPDAAGNPLGTDQRGVQRAVRGGAGSTARCDIGAYEADATILLTSTGPITYTEHDPPVAVDPGLALSDTNTSTLTGATVQIVEGYAQGQDLLAFSTQNGITGSFDASTGRLTLSGSATFAQYQAALRTVTFENTSRTPSTALRTVAIQVSNQSLGEASNVGTRQITVVAVNDAPTAVNDGYTVTTGQTLTVPAPGVLGNDTDVDSGLLTATLNTGVTAQQGTLTFNPDHQGGFSFTPAPSLAGTATFTYMASDGSATSTPATVSITVTNTAPRAGNDSYLVTANTPLTIAAPGVLANDLDAESPTLRSVKATDPAHGSVTLQPDGGFTYTPAAGYTGPDSFTYQASDGITQSPAALVNLIVVAATTPPTASNVGPVAGDDSNVVAVGTPLTVNGPGVLRNDVDPDSTTLTASKVTDPAHGTLTLQPNGGFTYTPAPGYVGADSFTYRASDGAAQSEVATVRILVTAATSPPTSPSPSGANIAPTAGNDSYTTIAQIWLTVPAPGLLANDTDPDSPSLTAIKATNPAHGTVDLNANGGFVYKPNPDFAGTDSFTYWTSDGSQLSHVATVTISVTPTACVPTPKVQTVPAPGGGKLQVHVGSTPLNSGQTNPLKELRFGTLQNARVTLNGQTISGGQTVTVPAGATGMDFTVERIKPGEATTVPFTVVNDCGEWPTFVGGGTGAGF